MFLARRLGYQLPTRAQVNSSLGVFRRNLGSTSGAIDDPAESHEEAVARGSKMPQPTGGNPVEVRAVYMARGIDIGKVSQNKALYAGCKTHFDDKSVTITLNAERNQYITVFNYGSVVLFNVPQTVESQHLEGIKRYAVVTPLSSPGPGDLLNTFNTELNTDTYRLMIHPELRGLPSVVKATHLNIKELDTNNITIVSTVMSQTVSLDYYYQIVDNLLEIFMKMNLKVEAGGSNAINALDRQQLYRLVASNNTVITNVLSKLGIFEGSDAAWENSDYHYTWEELRDEFELEYRYKDLSLKLNLVKDNVQFYLSLINAEKGEKLEKIIIVLIATEIILGLLGLYIDHH